MIFFLQTDDNLILFTNKKKESFKNVQIFEKNSKIWILAQKTAKLAKLLIFDKT